VTHDDVLIQVNVTVVALTLVVVMALGAQRQLLAAPVQYHTPVVTTGIQYLRI